MPAGRHRTSYFGPVGLVVSAAAVVVLAAGVVYLTRHDSGRSSPTAKGCAHSDTLTVLATPGIAPTLDTLARSYAAPGGCATVRVVSKDAPAAVDAFAAGWREQRDGPRPDVWVPDSNSWAQLLAARPRASRLLPADRPSLVSSPLVVALPRPMARAVGLPGTRLSWQDLLKLIQSPAGWGAYGHPEWGAPRIGLTEPARSTAGLQALIALSAAVAGKEQAAALPASAVSQLPVKITLLTLGRAARSAVDTSELLDGLSRAGSGGQLAALRYLSALPASEHDVLAYNRTQPRVPLTALYPSDGAPTSDFPYLTLQAPWVAADRIRAAADFLGYLRSPNAQARFAADGFRPPDSAPAGGPFTADNGLQPDVGRANLGDTPADAIETTTRLWSVLRRRSNTVSVYDVSGSMGDIVPSAGVTKLELCRRTAVSALPLFTDDDEDAQWIFATNLRPGQDYLQLVPPGPYGALVGGVPRRVAIGRAISAMQPSRNDTALYETVLAAYRSLRARYQPDRINTVILLTDGRNDDPGNPLDLPTTLARLKALVDPTRPIRLLTIAYGKDADVPALQAMSAVAAGKTYVAPDPTKIGLTFLDAITSF